MFRLLLLMVLIALGATATHAQDSASLEQLSAYLNSIDAAATRFRQINADGSVSTGILYIDRPGRARFEYEAPDDGTLVVVGNSTVGVFDGAADNRADTYPLSQTPLKLILAGDVDLTRATPITVIGTHRGMTIVEAQDRDRAELGKIRLYFETGPIRLAEWLITSETGEETRVVLEPLQPRSGLPRSLFDIAGIERSRN